MQNFVQYAPTEVIFGKGTEEQTGAAVSKWGGSRAVSYTHLTLPTILLV